MARTKRIFREWQHPRDPKGRFARTGSPAWAKAAAERFAQHVEARPQVASTPGRPRIGAKAKGAALLADHALPDGATRSHVRDIAKSPDALQVQYGGGWRQVVGHGSNLHGPLIIVQGERPGETIDVQDTGQQLPVRPYKMLFHDPLRPAQARQMAQWRRDAAKPPAFRIKTTGEENLADAEREVAEAEAALKDATRKARARANRKYPNKEGYSAYTRDPYVDRETGQEQHTLMLAEYRLNYLRNAAPDKYSERPGNGPAEYTGTLDPDRPLAPYGDLLHIDADDQGTYRHLQDLAQIPPELHALVAAMMFKRRSWTHSIGGDDVSGVYVGSKPVPELDHSQDLATVQPRGWAADRTWSHVDGAYRPLTSTLIVGVSEESQHRGEHGQPALHEFGHALDRAVADLLNAKTGVTGGADQASAMGNWRAVHKQVIDAAPNISPYFRQSGHAGPTELWAEAFSAWAGARARARTRERERIREQNARRRAQGRRELPPVADDAKYIDFSSAAAMQREFKIPRDRQDVVEALQQYFAGLVKALGVDL